MKVSFYRVNPGGNITAIVQGSFSKEERVQISKSVLASDTEIEQVGFWSDLTSSESVAHLEMMGGEFCGNGARSLAYVIWQEKKSPSEFYIESSGVRDKIKALVRENYSEIQVPASDFSELGEKPPVVCVPGICHLITSRRISREDALELLKDNNLLEKEAAGVISVQELGQSVSIKPVVWVRDTKTLYEETACASGALALAYLKRKKTGKDHFIITQPSGADFKVSFLDSGMISLSGPVLSVEKRIINVDLTSN